MWNFTLRSASISVGGINEKSAECVEEEQEEEEIRMVRKFEIEMSKLFANSIYFLKAKIINFLNIESNVIFYLIILSKYSSIFPTVFFF